MKKRINRFRAAWVYIAQALISSREILLMGISDFKKCYGVSNGK